MVFKGLIPSKSICSLNLQINKLSKLCFFWEKVCLWLDEKLIIVRYDENGFLEELPQLPETRYGHSCAALPRDQVRSEKGNFCKTCQGICCGWGTRGLTHKFLRAHAPPWGFVVDSGGLSSWDSIPSARLCRGRQHEGDWGKTWASWWQHWGEGSESYVFTFALFSFSVFCPLKTKLQLLHKIII